MYVAVNGVYNTKLEGAVDEEHYVNITKSITKYVPHLVRYKFTNLFSQNDLLGSFIFI